MNRSKVRLHVLLIVVLLALLAASAVGAAPKDGPTVSLSAAQGEFASGDDVLVTVTLSNNSNRTVRVLKWFTAVDGVEEPLFNVTRDGKAVPYTGAHYKRPAITGNDFISLKAGESVSSVVNLAEYYDFTSAGNYEVSYAVSSYNLFNEKANAFKYTDTLVSEKISFKANGTAAKGGKPTPPPPPPAGGNAFNACSIDQQALIVDARTQAKAYASNAENYLLGNNQGSRYVTWFGVYNATRYNTVKSNFTSISNAMDNAGIAFDCGCKQNYYAYVYPNQPYNIYLCRAFWQAPTSGTDSKAGTLIHEMSHFDVVAGTDDVVYGQTGAKSLAISDPNAAITNADSHEYFAENTPALP